jgi:hypothetical protein
MDGKMKTGIKMRVTPEQREAVISIANAHGLIRLSYSGTEGDFVVLYPKNDGDGFAIWDTRYLSFENHHYEEVDPELFIRTNGTCDKEFPPLEDIGLYCGAANLLALHFDSQEQEYEVYKAAYQDGANISWQLKQKDPHAELRKEFEETRESGEVVRVMASANDGLWIFTDAPKWSARRDYKLVYYKFNPTKALAWSYREGGVFIECNTTGWEHEDVKLFLMAVDKRYAIFNDGSHVVLSNYMLNIDKEGNVNLSNGTTVNIYRDGLIYEWLDERE